MENQLFSSVLFGAISAIPTSTLGLLGSCTLEKWHHLFVDGTKYVAHLMEIELPDLAGEKRKQQQAAHLHFNFLYYV